MNLKQAAFTNSTSKLFTIISRRVEKFKKPGYCKYMYKNAIKMFSCKYIYIYIIGFKKVTTVDTYRFAKA